MTLRVLAAACVYLSALAGCGSKEAAAQQSAAQVARAVEVLREADNAKKGPALAALSALPCQGEGVCEARDACRTGYTEHVEAFTLTQAAKQLMTDGKAEEAANLLGSAEEKLLGAGRKVTSCTEREAALRRRYKL